MSEDDVSTNIRKATPDELESLFNQTGEYFYQEKQLPGRFDTEKAVEAWKGIFLRLPSVIFVAETYDPERGEMELDGILGAIITNEIYDGRKIATEMFLFTVADARVWAFYKLLKAYHQWAKEEGAVETRMTHIISNGTYEPNEALERIYRKLGYRQLEMNYIRETQEVPHGRL